MTDNKTYRFSKRVDIIVQLLVIAVVFAFVLGAFKSIVGGGFLGLLANLSIEMRMIGGGLLVISVVIFVIRPLVLKLRFKSKEQ